MTARTPIKIERLITYSAADAAGIGRLMPSLTKRRDGSPVDEGLLREIIDSKHHEQFIARDNSGNIVGAATVSVVIDIVSGRRARLNDFVVDNEHQSHGVGQLLWDAIINWCQNNSLSLGFTSKPARVAAHKFYLKNGATVVDTVSFNKTIT